MSQRSTPHERHDPLLVASFAAGDLAGTERDHAASIVDACPGCRALHDDLVSIARATAALPAATRPRDFRISPEQAARLRPAGWRGLIAAFASPRLAVTRQLGVGLATLGIAGLLIGALPSFPLGMAASAPAAGSPAYVTTDTSGESAQGAPGGAAVGASAAPLNPEPRAGDGATPQAPAASPAASAFALRPEGSGKATAGGTGNDQRQSIGLPAGEGGAGAAPPERTGAQDDGTGSGPGTSSLLMVGSAILLVAGIALLVVRRAATRIVSS